MIVREGIQIGRLFLHFYGIIIIFGAIMAAVLAAYEAKRRKLSSDFVWDMLPWALIGGIIGARIWHILTPMPSQGITAMYYFTHPLDALAIWKGGLGIPGAVIGGALAVYIYTRKKGLIFLQWGDIAAPGLLLAQAIGRWGNFVNQEIYGLPTNLPWAVYIEPARRLKEYADVGYYHPLFLYESLWNLLNMGLLIWISRRFSDKLKNGDLLLIYCIMYPVTRFTLEFIRLDSSQVAGININQTVMVVIAILAILTLIVRHTLKKTEKETESTGNETK
jgi:phosphatidylglycerol---prolipoprotein diacylglyceryl transferase